MVLKSEKNQIVSDDEDDNPSSGEQNSDSDCNVVEVELDEEQENNISHQVDAQDFNMNQNYKIDGLNWEDKQNNDVSKFNHNQDSQLNASALNQKQDDEEEEEAKQDFSQEKEGIGINSELKKRFYIGENIDCCDTVNKWLNAEIVSLRHNPNEIRVHYSGWSQKYDEWISVDSSRILKQWHRSNSQVKQIPISVNNRLDVYHEESGQWLEAIVKEIQNEEGTKIKIHYNGYHSKYDEVVNLDDERRVQEVGTHSQAFGAARTQARNPLHFTKRLQEYIIKRERNFMQELHQKKNLCIKVVGTDGNCLFRAVSDQMYGTEEFHKEIRSVCMDYIQIERAFFENYIHEEFEDYINRKRQDGEWGDDIELEALSEIYNRPIEVYAYSSQPMRTFHETNFNNNEPIRLSYHGKCHYNSVKKNGFLNLGYLQISDQGKQEAEALKNSHSRHQRSPESNAEVAEAIQNSRKEFEIIGKRDMERALEESLQLFEESEKANNEQQFVDIAIKSSIDAFMEAEEEKLIIEQVKKETLMHNEQQEKQQTDDINIKYEQTQVKELEDLELQEAIKQSQANAPVAQEDPLLNPTIASVVAMGIPVDLAIQAYTIIGDFPDLIINYIYENYY
ncbi:OTU-like cysteine protease (macronuclear) [Tetrahymena thermophila SB210]|uniref:ubiquitinyl hydrolase 1 n=1 Tax=Tetrahymena thermophila (strain SB210) TaxID=312017 RepID=I7MGY2_TETTS|nr:OTU-like cysteine protease [Tetrahymena thermophila SB210]EAR85579.1 OTU-like cysteine protease [Tetrahymena thermophila SB210]|eukprot:XP_001033242.1 OTU-like cysteine protease [Tetrahymena thermophila SB210]